MQRNLIATKLSGLQLAVPLHRTRVQRIQQDVAQRPTLDLRTLPRAGYSAQVIVKDSSVLVGQTKTVEIGAVVCPESVHQTGLLQRGQPRVLVQIQRASLNARLAAGIALIHDNVCAMHLKQPRQRQSSRTSADDGDLLSFHYAHA
jgi:hypothetical protein